jgi:hypothetical protein
MSLGDRNIQLLQQDLEYWKSVAVYLADCHAATALDEGRMKSTPKNQKKRFRWISATAGKLLEGCGGSMCCSMCCVCGFSMSSKNINDVIERCVEGAKDE